MKTFIEKWIAWNFPKRPHRNEASGMCQGSQGLQDSKPAPSLWEFSELRDPKGGFQ